MHLLSVILASVLLASASAIIYDRECRGVTMVDDFALEKYARNWYENRRYYTSPQLNGDCSTFNYFLDYTIEHPDELQVEHRFSFLNNGTSITRKGTLSQRHDHHHHPPNIGHLMMMFDDAPHSMIKYCLIASDYENYAVVWSCEDLEDGRSNEDAWVLSTTQILAPQHEAAVQAAIDLELDESLMTSTYQGTNCRSITEPSG